MNLLTKRALLKHFQNANNQKATALVLRDLRRYPQLDWLHLGPPGLSDDLHDFFLEGLALHFARSRGHVYVAVNPVEPELVKIGRTGKNPEDRVGDLSGTSSRVPFVLAGSVQAFDTFFVERTVHKVLKDRRAGKEFFKVPFATAVALCNKIASADNAFLEKRLYPLDLNKPTADKQCQELADYA